MFDVLKNDPRIVGHTYYHNYTLLALSHSFEDLVFASIDGIATNPFQALIYATFESPELFEAELPRYRLLAEQSKQIYAFVGGEIEIPLPPNLTLISVDPNEPFLKEWNLLVYTPRVAALMSAREMENNYEDRSVRSYEGFWSFDAGLIQQAVDLLDEQVSLYLGPRRFSGSEYVRRHPLRVEDPQWLITTMTVDIIQYLQDMNRDSIAKTIEISLEKKRTEEAYKDTLMRLAGAAEFREEETGRHILRIGEYSALLAERLGMSQDQIEILRLASPMHDIGKIGIPDAILRKPGKLNLDEWNVMKSHTQIGSEILKDPQSPLMRMAQRIALYHHEKFDGSGYPYGLIGDEIPLEARIVAMVDVFDALISERCYKRAYSYDEALRMMKEQVGSHFDPVVAEQFFACADQMIEIHKRLMDESVPPPSEVKTSSL